LCWFPHPAHHQSHTNAATTAPLRAEARKAIM
jgi:hypothetical protein